MVVCGRTDTSSLCVLVGGVAYISTSSLLLPPPPLLPADILDSCDGRNLPRACLQFRTLSCYKLKFKQLCVCFNTPVPMTECHNLQAGLSNTELFMCIYLLHPGIQYNWKNRHPSCLGLQKKSMS